MRRDRMMGMVMTAVLLVGGAARAANPESNTAPPEPAPATKPPELLGPGIYNPWKPYALKPEHQILNGLLGKAATTVHVDTGPFPRAKDVTGTAEAKTLMGGAFVQVTLTDNRMKEPFERIMIYGWDPVIGKYTAEILDSTSPNIVRFIGTYDPEKKQLNMTARYSEHNTHRYVTARLVTTFVDANNWSFEEFLKPAQDKPETQVQTVKFRRG